MLHFCLDSCDRVFADDPSYSRSAIEALELTHAIHTAVQMLYNNPTFNPQNA